MTTPSAADDDALLDRLRRADFGSTPFSRVSDDDDFESGPGGVFTRQAVAQLKAGSNAKRLAGMHAANGFRADLYAVGVAGPQAVPGAQRDLRLLVVRRGEELSDIAGGMARPALPDGGFEARMKQFQPNIVLGMPWTAVVSSAITLAVKAAWPEHDMRIGFSSGGGWGTASHFAIKSTVADWAQISPERRDQILDAIGSAAGRLYGLTRPNSKAGQATIVVGIEAADEITAPSAPRALVLRTSAGEYLASKMAAATLWQSNDS
jgi:hypothetical protein